MNLHPLIFDICRAVDNAGGQAWIVGGAVRDAVMDIESKDLDIEVHRIESDDLREMLQRFGHVNAIGKSFGVYKLTNGELDVDISIPRHDNQVGPAHNDVEIVGNPFMGIESAARRRDLTINAIAYDPLRDQFADPFGGIKDIQKGRLVAVDEQTFPEDPLRVLRVVQFAARFGFTIQPELVNLCRKTSLYALPAERIWGEFEKLLLMAPIPSVGWKVAHELDVLDRILPELATLPTTAIEQALNRAAERRAGLNSQGRQVALMVSAMMHSATQAQVVASLDRLEVHKLYGFPVRKRIIEATTHWKTLSEHAEDRVLRRLAEQTEVLLVAETAYAVTGNKTALANLDRAFRLGVGVEPLPVLLKGRDLARLGVSPGPNMGAVLNEVREAQIEGVVSDRDGAIVWLEDHLK